MNLYIVLRLTCACLLSKDRCHPAGIKTVDRLRRRLPASPSFINFISYMTYPSWTVITHSHITCNSRHGGSQERRIVESSNLSTKTLSCSPPPPSLPPWTPFPIRP